MRIHHLTVEEAFASLQSGPQGLSAAEAVRRQAEFGPNVVEQAKREPLSLRFLKGFTHFFAIILWIAAALAFFAEIRDPGQGMATLGFAIIGVIFVNGVFSFWQEYRAEKALQALQELLPHETKVVRDGKVMKLVSAELVPGDVILLESGEDIPADCRLIEAFGVRVNTATVTGESLPHSRDERPSVEAELLHSTNVLLAGTSVVVGEAKALVFATGAHTAFGQIAHLTQVAKAPLSPLQKEIVRISRLIAFLALGMGAVFYTIGQAIGLSFWANFIFAIGIIVANVPEGLLPTVTLALALGSQRMAKRHALIRHLPAVETLGSTTVICTDKTGTLTQNRMAVKRILWASRFYEPGEITPALAKAHRQFFEVARCCQNVKRVEQRGEQVLLGDPMEIALAGLAANVVGSCCEYRRLNEIPFTAERRRMSAIHESGDGPVLYMKGAPEVVVPRCSHIELGEGPQPLSGELESAIRSAQDSMAEQGLRVLAFAYRKLGPELQKPKPEVHNHGAFLSADSAGQKLEEHLVFCGLVGLEDPPRPEVPAAIQKCQQAGIKIIMVTGDHPHTAHAIAREIGLVKSAVPVVITGEQLRHLSNTQLQLALDAREIIFARVGADQKMRIVSALKRKKEIVAVTGDGVNDAPALKQADIGISMGLCGTDVARESADMVLLDDNFATIVAAIEEGRAVFANIRKFLTYILTSNVPEMVPYLAFVLFRIPLPLTIIQILAVDLGTDMVPALALGAEPPNPETMKAPPRSLKERLLNWPLLVRAYWWLGLMQAAAAMAAFFFVLHRGGWQYGQNLGAKDPLYLQATTACLCAIVVMQVVNVFNCRSRRQSVFGFGLFSNPFILLGLLVEITLILLITYTAWGNLMFGTAPIPLSVWLCAVPFAGGLLLLEELRKWAMRALTARHTTPGLASAAAPHCPLVHSP